MPYRTKFLPHADQSIRLFLFVKAILKKLFSIIDFGKARIFLFHSRRKSEKVNAIFLLPNYFPVIHVCFYVVKLIIIYRTRQ